MDLVKVSINDLSFQHMFGSKETAIRALRSLITVYRELMVPRKYTKIDGLYGNTTEITETEIVRGVKIVQILNEIKLKEEREILRVILTKLRPFEYLGAPFQIDGKNSFVCAFSMDGAVISLNGYSLYENETINGIIGKTPCMIRNVSKIEHIKIYESFFGRRIYQRNPKHGHVQYYTGKGKPSSVMDLSDNDAQELLDRAIQINEGDRLYAKRNGNYYVYPLTSGIIYHGYRCNELQEHIRLTIDREFD